MQNLDKKASILLWAVFLSMIIVIAFTSINYQLRQNLTKNNSLIEKINFENEKNKQIGDIIEKKEFKSVILSNNEKIIFKQDNIITKWFKIDESLSLKVEWEEKSNITIKVLEWWPIYYKNPENEWIITKQDTINIKWEINIENMWWYADITITSENKFENNTKKYKIVREYGTKTIIKETWEITIN